MKKLLIIFSALLFTNTTFATGSYSYDDNSADRSNLRTVKKLLKKKQYQAAIDKLWSIEKSDKKTLMFTTY